ncbi:nuclear transport factor 2 family protein [Brachybacterium sp. GCM10030267]|uniref:nuclear transport factor 2 family protein n=1 Tax=Brachybacterium sp. GCM10030267 TaxID=3273381 RepID=UPI00361B74DB
MEMTMPGDCGNSPRMAIVADVAAAWASGDHDAIREWLTDDARWVRVGADGPDASHGGPAIVPPPFEAERGEILTVVNHGRGAACDGYLIRGEDRADFCHVLRFAGAARTARIREVRTYLPT